MSSRTRRAQQSQSATNISALSDDLLCKIFLLVPQRQRLRAVPGTCSRWQWLMLRPDMWQRLSCCRHVVRDKRDPVVSRLEPLMWLQRRSSAMTSFHIELPEDGELCSMRWDDLEVQAILLALGLAPQLKQFSIKTRDMTGICSQTLAHVQMFSGLTSLSCDGLCGPVRSSDLVHLFAGLPALRSCTLRFPSHLMPEEDSDPEEWDPAEFPHTLLWCTRLTSLVVTVPEDADDLLDWGGLPPNITALQQLSHLRLQHCLTEPLTEALTGLTGLTHLGRWSVNCKFSQEPHLRDMLPPALAAMSWLRCVNIANYRMPTALPGLIGLEDLTLRNASRCQELSSLSSLKQLSRLQLVRCKIHQGADITGLGGCTALVSLHLVQCQLKVPQLAGWYSQLRELCLAGNLVEDAQLVCMLEATPQLASLDISGNERLQLQPADVLAALQCSARLKHVYLDGPDSRQLEPHVLDAVLHLQRALPGVLFHLVGAASHQFDAAASRSWDPAAGGTTIGIQDGYALAL